MSCDVSIWKWKEGAKASAGLVDLLLSEDLHCDSVEGLELDRLRRIVDEAFPNWDREEGEDYGFEVSFGPKVIQLSLYGSTPERVLAWFEQFVQSEGLFMFVPHEPQISASDWKAYQAAKEEARGRRQTECLRRELPDLLSRAEAGDADAQSEIGNRYFFGEGVQANITEAVKWYERSALQDNHNGQFNLADCYRKGQGVPLDINKAIGLLEQSAAKDKVLATFELGEIYARGEGVPKDKEKARSWYQIALSHGHAGARKALMLLEGSPLQEPPKASSEVAPSLTGRIKKLLGIS